MKLQSTLSTSWKKKFLSVQDVLNYVSAKPHTVLKYCGLCFQKKFPVAQVILVSYRTILAHVNSSLSSYINLQQSTDEHLSELHDQWALDEMDYCNPFQSELRSGHGMETELITLRWFLVGSLFVFALLELSVTFDSINHDIFLDQFGGMGVNSTVLDWFSSFVWSSPVGVDWEWAPTCNFYYVGCYKVQ